MDMEVVLEEGHKISAKHRGIKRPAETVLERAQDTKGPYSVDQVETTKAEHVEATLEDIAQPETLSKVVAAIQTRSDREIAESHKYVERPEIMTSWKVGSLYNEKLQSNVFTLYDEKLDGTPVEKAAKWEPTPKDDRDKLASRIDSGILPLYLKARDRSRSYSITKAVAAGSYGSVYFGKNEMGQNVALKFTALTLDSFLRLSDDMMNRKIVSPGKIAGLIAHYALQRFYGGCTPTAVCMYDSFLYARPTGTLPTSPMAWYIVIVMEQMEGNLTQLGKNIARLKEMNTDAKFVFMIDLFVKMTRAVFDLEVQRIFHNDIKPFNFLYKKKKDGTYLIKATDFDLSCFASRTFNTDGERLLNAVIRMLTDDAVDTSKDPWGSDGNTRRLLKCQLQTTDVYEPPEYQMVKDVLTKHRQNRNEYNKIASKTIRNADWVSRMMAYQLVCSFREIALDMGFNAYYISNTYPLDISHPSHNRVAVPYTGILNQMSFETNVKKHQMAIAPMPQGTPLKRREFMWQRVSRETINALTLTALQCKNVAISINSRFAEILTSKIPDAKDFEARFLVASVDRWPVERPSVAELLRYLVAVYESLHGTVSQASAPLASSISDEKSSAALRLATIPSHDDSDASDSDY